MKQNINEIKRMQRIAGLITESEYRESLINEDLESDIRGDLEKVSGQGPILDPVKLKELISLLKRKAGNKGDRESYKKVADLLASNQLAKAADFIVNLDTSPKESIWGVFKFFYPELWDMMFDDDESGYIAAARPKGTPLPPPSAPDPDDNKLGFSSDVKAFIDDAVKSAKKDGSFEELMDADYFEEDFIDYMLEKFDEEGEYDGVKQAVMDYIAKVTK